MRRKSKKEGIYVAWQPTPVFLPREFHWQRSLVGYSPQGLAESDMTEATLHVSVSVSVSISVTYGYIHIHTADSLCCRAETNITL